MAARRAARGPGCARRRASVRALAARAYRRASAVALRSALPACGARRHEAARPVGLQRPGERGRAPDADHARGSRRAPSQRPRRKSAGRRVRGERRAGVERQPGARCRGRGRGRRLRTDHRCGGTARRRALHGGGGICLGALTARDVRIPDCAGTRGARRVPAGGGRGARAHLPGARRGSHPGPRGESGVAGAPRAGPRCARARGARPQPR